MPHDNYLMFLDETKSWGVPVMTRRKLGWMPKMTAMKLVEATNELVDRPYVVA